MNLKNDTIFNAKLFPHLENGYKVNHEPEIEQSLEKDKEDEFNNYDLIEPLINSLINEDDFMKNNHCNKIQTFSLSKGKKSVFSKNNKSITKIKKKKKKEIKKLKNYNIKKGDWLCKYCNNLNFSFRIICNKCGKNKE